MTSIANTTEGVFELNQKLVQDVDKLSKENSLLKQTLEELKERLRRFERQTFGRSRESIHPDQLRLFAKGLGLDSDREPEKEEIRYTRRKTVNGHGRAPFPDHLPRKRIEVDLPDEEKTCDDCGQDLIRIKELVTERGEVVPSRIVVNQYVRPVWACKDGCCAPKQADLPPGVIDKTKWEPSAYTHVVVSKYADHQPLNRQMGIFKRHGFRFAKSTMWDMARRAAELLSPIVLQMRKEILASRLIGADETPIQVINDKKPKGKGSDRGFIWVYHADKKIVFDFTTSRSRAGPSHFLGSWSGTLLTDDYTGYNAVCQNNGILRALCWAHARRKFKDALDSGDERTKPPLRAIQVLFRIEQRIRDRAAEKNLDGRGAEVFTLEIRQRFSARVLEWLRIRILELKDDPRVLPKSPLGKAVRYVIRTQEKWERFSRFLDVGALPMDNNAAERALRLIAVGRANWHVAGSVVGADVGAVLYSLVASCRALEVHVEEYMSDVLRRIDVETDVTRLTPWAWNEARAALNS